MKNRISARLERLGRYLWSKKTYKFVAKQLIDTDIKAAGNILNAMYGLKLVTPIETKPPKNKKILVIAPHPDDEMIGPGGMLIQASQAGSTVKVVYVTSGPAHESQVREREATAVLQRFGWAKSFLRMVTGDIVTDSESIQSVVGVLSSEEFDILCLPFFLDDNVDHKATAFLVNEACKGLTGREGVEAWAYQVYTGIVPNVAIDITEVAEIKSQSIAAYESQRRSRDWAHYAMGLNAWNVRLIPPLKGPSFVEGFFVLPLKDYIDLTDKFFTQNLRS